MSTLHSLIDKNFFHPHYGRLLYHRDSPKAGALHYSVQLNDSESLGWQPIHHSRQQDIGRVEIWQVDWNRFQPAQWVMHLEKVQIKKALHLSVNQFHEKWQYQLFRFNCEHWARLVTTGDCRCYQIQEFKKLQQIPIVGGVIVGIAGVATGAWEHNGYAQELIVKL
ncbi:MAG TPA: hypothetical protein VL134_13630 [Leptolyngbya sp.]|jgi:hypothetical protein|nr:hypothetical protein [Leptolyngbya sp.]